MAQITWTGTFGGGGTAGGGYATSGTISGATIPAGANITSINIHQLMGLTNGTILSWRVAYYRAGSTYFIGNGVSDNYSSASGSPANESGSRYTLYFNFNNNLNYFVGKSNCILQGRANCSGTSTTYMYDIAIIFNYDLPSDPSTGTICNTSNQTITSILASSTIRLKIANTSVSSFTHTVVWKIGTGSTYSSGTLNVGVSSSPYNDFFIPLSWVNAFTSSTRGSATVVLTTFRNGASIGSKTYTFDILVPDNIVPSISSFTATRIDNTVPSSWGIYIQHKSSVRLTTTAAGNQGSTISSYSVKGDGFIGASDSYTAGPINSSGTVVYTVTVTDTRNRTASASVSISVYAYETLQLTSSNLTRCLSNGTPNESGTYGKISGTINFSSCNNNNAITSYKIYYKNIADPDTNYIAITESGVSGSAYVFGGGALSEVDSYNVKIVITDTFGTITQIMTLPSALFTMFFRTGGKGVAFGQASSRENAVEINGNWGLWIGDKQILVPIVSGTQPSNPINGTIWLKPVS